MTFRLALITTVFCLIGCSSTPTVAPASCDQKDWYELGRHDGAQGAQAEKMSALKNQCSPDFHSEWETMYSNGRNAGLVEYCEPANGYELGRSGQPYYYVCPSTMEPQFLSGFRRGQAAFELEQENKKLDAKIDSIAQQLMAAENNFQRNQLSSEMEQLKKLRALNDRKLNKVSK